MQPPVSRVLVRAGSRAGLLVRLVFVMVLVLPVAGCAIGPVGVIAGRVSTVEGGWLLETYTIGAHLRTAIADDYGIGLGTSKRIYLFALDDMANPLPGWYMFFLPRVPLERSLLRYVESIGIDVHLGAPEPGIIAGIQRLTATRPLALGSDEFRDLRFSPWSSADTCVSTRLERPC